MTGGIFPLVFDAKKSTPGTRILPATQATIATLIATLFDGLMDSNHGRTDTNIHKVAQIGEYCGGIPKGTVQVGINVGSCVGEKSSTCLYWMELRDPNHDRGSSTDFSFIKVSRSVELNKKIKQLTSRMTLFLKPGPGGCSPKVDSGAPHLSNNWGQPEIALKS